MEGSPHMNQLLQQEVAEKQDPTFKININENNKASPIFQCFPLSVWSSRLHQGGHVARRMGHWTAV